MPYRDKKRDRAWHRDHMRNKRGVTGGVTEAKAKGATKRVTPKMGFEPRQQAVELDADGHAIPE